MAAKEQFDMADVVQYRHAPLGATETMHDTMLGQSLAINPGWYYDRKELFVGYYGPGIRPPPDGEIARSGLTPEEIKLKSTQGPPLLAGCEGYTAANQLFVNLLWVHDSLRGAGIGSKLLAAAEEEAKRRGARGSYLDTFDYQAPKFYEAKGYKLLHKIENCYPDGGSTRYYYGKVFE